MRIKIAPFTVEPSCNCMITSGLEEDEHMKHYHRPIKYWGVCLDDKFISYVSSKERAEETKMWIERWLNDRL